MKKLFLFMFMISVYTISLAQHNKDIIHWEPWTTQEPILDNAKSTGKTFTMLKSKKTYNLYVVDNEKLAKYPALHKTLILNSPENTNLLINGIIYTSRSGKEMAILASSSYNYFSIENKKELEVNKAYAKQRLSDLIGDWNKLYKQLIEGKAKFEEAKQRDDKNAQKELEDSAKSLVANLDSLVSNIQKTYCDYRPYIYPLLQIDLSKDTKNKLKKNCDDILKKLNK